MTPAGRRFDRRTVVKGFGSSALLGFAGISLGCDGAPPTDAKPTIFDLDFEVQQRYRPFELVAPGFEQIDEPASVTLRSLTRSGQVPVAPFAAIELSVGAAGEADVVTGLFGDGGDFVAVVFSPRRSQASIEVRRAGRTRVVAAQTTNLAAPFRAAFAVCENQVTALADTGEGWQPIVTDREGISALVDLRQPESLSGLSFGYGTDGAGGDVRLGKVRAGPFGMTGLRDPHLVQRPDGSAYIRDGKAYLTFTCAGLGFFQQAHWGVFTLDLDRPTRLQQVAQLYTRRDGFVLGDHAGQVVVDEANGESIVLNSSWGDFDGDGVHIRHARTRDDLLAGVHLLETDKLALPTTVSSWDPAATRIDDRWHVAFVESPSQDPFDFHPALASGAAGGSYDEGLELIAADKSRHMCEGPILQRVDDQWYLLASDGDRHEYPVYDLAVKQLGTLDAPYGTNIPHPQVVERPGGGYLMVTFDGTQYAEDLLGYGTHGDVVVMSSTTAM